MGNISNIAPGLSTTPGISQVITSSLDNGTQHQKAHVNVLVVGPSGAGKSTLVNTLAGQYISKVVRGVAVSPVTKVLTPFETVCIEIGGRPAVDVCFWDCPGFTGRDSDDDPIIADIERLIPSPGIVLICCEIAAFGGRRMEKLHNRHIRQLKRISSGRLFDRCIIAITKVDSVARQYEDDASPAGATKWPNDPEWYGEFTVDVCRWKEAWRDIMAAEGIDRQQIEGIPICFFGEMKFCQSQKKWKRASITPIGPWKTKWLSDSWKSIIDLVLEGR